VPPLSSFELYQAFQLFDDDSPERWADFERLNPDDLLRLVPEVSEGPHAGQSQAFEAIGMTNSASLIAFWQEPNLVGIERPIVYIDSEGSPTSVFADSFADFLTLLPYGTDFLYAIINQSERVRARPELLGTVYKPFTPIDAQEALEINQQEYPEQKQYMEWLTTVAGLAIAPDPVSLMEQAYQQHTNLEKWLGWTE
jgi:hypothetical protein